MSLDSQHYKHHNLQMDRYILHCDLDCFFAAVEQRDNPELEGKPTIVGADPLKGKGRGVISTCNYEARKFGLHSAMPISQAYKLCPQGVYLKPNHFKYKEASDKVMAILKKFSPVFQYVGMDEAYLDMSHLCDITEVTDTCLCIQREIKSKVGITISIGCASSKSIAKIASDYNKPNGITIIRDKDIKDMLRELEVTRIPGIGPKSKPVLRKIGIRKIGDIIDYTPSQMINLFGNHGKWIWKVINGLDKRRVDDFHGVRKSISQERTFYEDTDDFSQILAKLEEINDKIDKIVERKGILYKTITLKIRLEGFLTFTRSKTLQFHMHSKEIVLKTVLSLYKEFEKQNKKVRLLGIKLSNLLFNQLKQKTILEYAKI